jgi:gliding motility-associated-like protein
VVDDIHQCDPDTVTGSFICNCGTNAGTMDINPVTACESDTISLIPPTGVNLDPDDSLVYVVHLGFPDSILLISDSLNFTLASPLLPGVTYFVSSVAGNASGGIGVDLSDPCLSVSFGTPIMWTAEPSGGIGGTTGVCEGDSATLTFFLTGTGPFDVTYSDGSNIFQANNITPGHTIKVLPTATTVYTLTDIAETIPPFCIGHPGTTHSVEVFQNYLIPLTSQICFGDSLLVAGAYQKAEGIYHDSLLTTHGCDSVLVTTLTVYSLDTTYLTDKSCDPSQTGVFTNVLSDQHGCDSTIITTVTFSLVDTTEIQSNTCDQLSAGVFSNLLTGQDGCDSLVIETITYLPPDSTWISGTTCVPADAGTFIEVLMNGQGCDSFIIETILLVPSDTTILTGETCDPGIAGVFSQTLTNSGGCDSLVIETIALLPTDTTILNLFTCFPQDTGLVEQIYTNSYGCDSLLWTITSLLPPDSCLIPVIHREFFIPNVFSPNGDGLNDFFFISSHPEAVSSIPLLRIYDRWGGLVYEGVELTPNQPEDGWDGNVKGEPINPAVFTWVAEIVFTDGKSTTLYGDVTLMK